MRHGQTRRDNDDNTVTISGPCTVLKGMVYTVTVPTDAYDMWECGMLAQKVMPMLTAEDREFLISGISPAGWTHIFPEKDE